MPKSLDARKKYFLLFVVLLILVDLSVALNIPVLRPVLSFIFLTFLPGWLIIYTLRLNNLDLTTKIVLSVGLSVAFSILFGLMLNASLLAIGYTKPLSTASLLISFSIATIILAVVAYIRNKEITFSFSNLKLTTREKMLLVVPSLFPLLSIVGMRIINLTDNNVLLMVLFFLIPAYVIFISFYRRKVPQRLYPSLIYLISISLILMFALRSNHLIGSDIHELYYAFQMTLDNLHWRITTNTLVDAILGTSLLPSVYQSFLNINQEYLYKVLYSLLFSISPLAAYIIAKKYLGNFYAFLASYFFMSQVIFLRAEGSASTITAILFFSLAIMVLFHDGMNMFARKLLFIIFALSCLLSHYSTSYIFFFVLLLTWIGMQTIPRVLPGKRKVATSSENPITEGAPSNSSLRGVMPRSDANANNTSQSATFNIPQSYLKGGITLNVVALFFVALFFWYSQITAYPFRAGVGLIHKTFTNLNQWFLLEAETKGPTIAAATGEAIYTLPQQIRVVFSWLTIVFIVIGVLYTLARYKRMISVPKSGDAKPDFLGSKFEVEYFVLTMACITILGLSVLLPYVMKSYDMERTYFQMLTVLSTFFVIGGIMIAQWLKARPHWIILAVLIPFFMCTTGIMYQISGVPASMILNSSGSEYEQWYIHDQDSYAAKWIKEHGKERVKIYSGVGRGDRVLISQGKIPTIQTRGLSFLRHYQQGKKIDGYIYLRYTDITFGRVVTKYPDIFSGRNKIYTSNGSQVYE